MNDIDNCDCFASYKTFSGRIECSALNHAECEKCKFYRNDIKREDIERDIDYYIKGKVSKKDEYRLQ